MADIFHQFFINASKHKVFDAISTPEEYKLWFGPQFDWRAIISCLIPDTELEYEITRAMGDWLGTRVGFRLIEKGENTQVYFHHSGWQEANEHYKISCYCWAMYLRLLKRYVEFGEVVPYKDRLKV